MTEHAVGQKPRTYKPQGYVLQVGDKIEASIGSIFRRVDIVTRVTKTLAICEHDGVVRYPRVYSISFYAKPYQRTNVKYRVLDET